MTNTLPSEQETIVIPVIEEVLSVGKRTVDTGRGVRVFKTVQTQPAIIDITLAREEIDVRHVNMDRTLDPGETIPGTRYEGDVLIVPVLEEVLVVERRMHLKEELHITRIQREEPYTRTEMLKTEQVSIERFDENGNS
jgi:uncharacterized protein (TIGR02271 family)